MAFLVRRLLALLVLQGAGATLGGWLAMALHVGLSRMLGLGTHEGWVLAGVLSGFALATWSAVAIDTYRARRVLLWLRNEEATASVAPSLHGLWGEAADRMRRRTRESERRLAESRDRLEEILAALQASPNGVILLDEAMHIEWCNQTAADHFGIDVKRDMLQSLGNLVRDPAFAAYIAAGNYSTEVVMHARLGGSGRAAKLSVQLHLYGKGRSLLLSRDVTAVEQADAMRRDFVANVSHEVRTPLTVLIGFVETLQTLQLDEQERTHYLGLMAQQAARMQSVVSDLLTLSRLEGSPPPGRGGQVPVQALLAHCQQEATALSSVLGRNHTIVFPSAQQMAATGSILGAQTELQSAMSNLLGNAVRYTPAGGTITVSWTVLQEAVSARGPVGDAEFAVRDSGPGIASEHIPRLTERFYRVDRSRSRETGGTGLGLAIVKHVMQRHGGKLRIESQPGQGSTFALVLPGDRLRPASSRLEA